MDLNGGGTRDSGGKMIDRIKLAEAMGLDGFEHGDIFYIRQEGFNTPLLRFDPFTDANDDYAVLEWMRSILADSRDRELTAGFKWTYQIGDYARAALKVIDD
jgi:hypothetical protein